MDNFVIAFAGPIGSGKSTVSVAIAEALGLSRASFGDHVRSVAKQRGLTQDRETLQLIGSELIENGWGPFCKAVLSQAGWKKGDSIIVDGIRHSEAIEALRQMTAPLKFILFFISIEEEDRQSRLMSKGIIDKREKSKVESHSTEAQVNSLRSKASLVLDGTQPILELVRQIIGFISSNF